MKREAWALLVISLSPVPYLSPLDRALKRPPGRRKCLNCYLSSEGLDSSGQVKSLNFQIKFKMKNLNSLALKLMFSQCFKREFALH